MAKVRKKHSRKARDQRLYSNVRAWMWEAEPADGGNDYVLHVERKTIIGWCTIADRQVIDNLFGQPRNWVVCARALVRNPSGDEWMEQADITLPSCKLLDVKDAYDNLRGSVLEANQLRHVYDCGWIAQTWTGDDPSQHDPDWVYHDAPRYLCPKHVPAGLGYTGDRRDWWQIRNEAKNNE